MSHQKRTKFCIFAFCHKRLIKVFMIRTLLLITWIVTFITLQTQAQNFWKKIDEVKFGLRSNNSRKIVPEKYQTFQLDIEGLRKYLQNAPMEFSQPRSNENNFEVEIPMPDGSLEVFVINESPVMEPELSAKYPEIKSYKGYSPADKLKQIRFSLSGKGFHAAISAADGEKYIDPYSSENTSDYIIYNTKDYKEDGIAEFPVCGVDDSYKLDRTYLPTGQRNTPLVELRIYRLAMACTGEWGAKRGTVALVLTDMNIVVNRMNLIYERDMAVRFVLINDNEKLIFLNGATDPYDTPTEGKKLVNVNTGKINAIISSSAYDIGHVMTVFCTDNISGVAAFGSLCQITKGNGVTCQGSESLSVLVTRVLAHEVGHQLNASHSWNICTSAADQRSPNTAFEPGSGSTIMSYAGSCGSDNVASDNDDYFHVGSLEQMYAKTLSSGNAYACAQKIQTANHFPVITKPNKTYVIPLLTPFELSATATDEDGDALTYTWEEYDTGEISPLGTASETAPLFRSLRPSSTGNSRFFPKSSSIASGDFTDKTEVLPNTGRKLSFRITARDNNPTGGGVVWEDYNISSSDKAGPFKITFPEIEARFKVGQEVTVTWDVANTNTEPVNCKTVNIYGSYNGILKTGDTNLVPLALNVPNDGSQEVVIPNRITNFFRIVIKAADNIFLTSSIRPSIIEQPTAAGIYFETSEKELNICQPNLKVVDFTTAGLFGFSGNIFFEIASVLPPGISASFGSNSVKAGGANTLNINTSNVKGNVTGQITIRAFASGVDTLERILNINVTGNDLAGITTISPVNGVSGVLALPEFSWSKTTDAQSYEIQIATGPDFTPSNIIFSKSLNNLSVISDVILNRATIHYWRVRGINGCGSGPWTDTQAFMTEALFCKTYESGVQTINISASGSPSVEIPVLVPDDGIATDINIKLIRAEHSRLSDLEAFLISPSGKSINLWSKKCGTQKNLNLGLDDQSADFFQCPINTGIIYRPENPLSGFNNESLKGNWLLRIDDKQSGEGGKLQEFNLELCSNISVSSPFILKNDKLNIHPGNKAPINNSLLLVSDNNNTPEELVFTLVSKPKEGILLFNGLEIKEGAKFTQAEINSSKLVFDDTSDNDGADFFTFTVNDGQGGWIPITKFEINRSSAILNSTSDDDLKNAVFISPNPTYSTIYVSIHGHNTSLNRYTINDISGRILKSGILDNVITPIDLDDIASGIYFISLSDGINSVTKKIVKY